LKTLTIDRLRELFDRQEGGAFIRRSDARPMLGDHVGAGLIGVRGVTLDRFTGRFKAQIQLGGKNFHLGRFDTVDEASSAYQRARSDLHTHSPAA
jgi:hypothetical protein